MFFLYSFFLPSFFIVAQDDTGYKCQFELITSITLILNLGGLMKLDVTREVEQWLDEKRGERSRASFILFQLREMMNNESTRQENNNGEGMAQAGEIATQSSAG